MGSVPVPTTMPSACSVKVLVNTIENDFMAPRFLPVVRS
jgi:hypothetical protein